MDVLHGIFTAYEMRIEQENIIMKEATFKGSKNTKKKNKQNSKLYCICNDDSEEDEKVEKIIRKLKRGIDKYKGRDEEEYPKNKNKNKKGDKRRC
jgi:hypothetical protein